MASVKSTRKIYKKKNKTSRTTQSRTISFFIGIITVAIIGLLVYNFAQNKNYKTVLGEKTIEKITPVDFK